MSGGGKISALTTFLVGVFIGLIAGVLLFIDLVFINLAFIERAFTEWAFIRIGCLIWRVSIVLLAEGRRVCVVTLVAVWCDAIALGLLFSLLYGRLYISRVLIQSVA